MVCTLPVELRPADFPPVPAIDTQPIPEGIPAKSAAKESLIKWHFPSRANALTTGANSFLSSSQSTPAKAKVESTISLRSTDALAHTALMISSKFF